VAVFDFFNTLTTNGGTQDINDLGQNSGNHHRLLAGVVQHKTDGDNDANPNVLEYPSGDDHPSRAGNLKAVAEFLPWLNVQYHCWQGTGGCSSASPSATTARAISDTQIRLSWKDNSLDESQFLIERKPLGCTAAGAWTPFAVVAMNATAFTDTGLTANTTYGYRVRAANALGYSDYSPCVAARTGLAGTPLVPDGLTATGLAASAIKLVWTDKSSNETGFRIYRQADSAAWTLLKTLGANLTTYTDKTAAGNPTTTSYRYYVVACNGAGCSPATAMAVVPQAPTSLGATPAGSGRLKLGWTDKSAIESGFFILRRTGTCAATTAWARVGTAPANTVSFQNTGLTSGATYAYQVQAFVQSPDQPTALGRSLPSNCISAKAP
jgi:hypothetical protein